MVRVVNQGIDSRLEAVVDSRFDRNIRHGFVAALNGSIESENDLKVICRRLCELSNELYREFVEETGKDCSEDGCDDYCEAERLAVDLWATGMSGGDDELFYELLEGSHLVWQLLKD